MIHPVYLSFVVPLIFLIMVTKSEARTLILFFAWGLTAAWGVYGLSGLLDSYTDFSLAMRLVFIFPALEELLKIVPLFIFVFRDNRTYKYSFTRYALAAGIGFSILENYLYLDLISFDGNMAGVYIIMRSLTACLLHGAASALIGLGFQYMFNYRFFSLPLFLGVYLSATAVHGLYNLLGVASQWALAAFIIPLLFFTMQYYLLNAFGGFIATQLPKVEERN